MDQVTRFLVTSAPQWHLHTNRLSCSPGLKTNQITHQKDRSVGHRMLPTERSSAFPHRSKTTHPRDPTRQAGSLHTALLVHTHHPHAPTYPSTHHHHTPIVPAVGQLATATIATAGEISLLSSLASHPRQHTDSLTWLYGCAWLRNRKDLGGILTQADTHTLTDLYRQADTQTDRHTEYVPEPLFI